MIKNKYSKSRETVFAILSFLIPSMIICIVMLVQGIFPFGDKTVLVWDLEIQYWKQYCWLHDLLHGETGLFYSFSQALGGNMYAPAVSNVLCCPFNWLVYFFNTAHIAEFFSVVTILKLATCGLTFYIFSVKRFGIERRYLLLFSTSYALMEYNVSLCSNIHFIDSIYALPIVALGVYYLVNEGKKGLLYISVIYVISVNWYTGYMVCFFSVFYCLFEQYLLFQSKSEWKITLKVFLNYCITMLIGTCTSAVALFPALLASTGGKGKFELQYLKPQFHCEPLYILRSLFITSEGNINYEQPAIYVSALIIMLVLMMYLDKEFSKRKKTACFLLALYIFASFSFVPLEIVWTILKKTYSFHFRYAFLFSFVLILSACFYFEELEEKGFILSRKLCLGTAGLIGLYFGIQHMVEPFQGKRLIYYYLGLFWCFGIVLYWVGRVKTNIKKWILFSIIMALLIGEQFYNVNHSFSRYQISNKKFIEYAVNTEKIISQINADNEEEEFRMEKTYSEMTERRAPMVPADSEGLAFSYKGISYYHSIYDANINDFLAYVGYCKQNAMATNYVDTNLLMDTILGIKYVITDQECPLVYEKIDYENLPEGVYVYRNNNALSFGTMIDKNVSNFEWSNDNNSFANQQKIFQMITGNEEAEQVLEKQKHTEQVKDGKRVWDISVMSDGPLYCYWKAEHEDTSVYVNGMFRQVYFSRFYKNVIYLGEYKKGDHVEVSMQDAEDCAKQHGFEAYTINLTLFNNIIDGLRGNMLQQTDITGSTLTGELSAEKSGVLWLSIPYDTGWKIWLNGKRVAYKKILNGFIGIDINEGGGYKLIMKYTPPYFRVSLAISLISLGGFIAWNKKSLK